MPGLACQSRLYLARAAVDYSLLEEELRAEGVFNELIGSSRVLTDVLKQVQTVAPTYATVLINGETGTCKELMARAVHQMSTRRDGPFVKLNCGAIPATLLESELFGHAKGAFTGAVNRQLGRLELADGGTIFLDEIGELPLELQPKLLRVLQDSSLNGWAMPRLSTSTSAFSFCHRD